MLPIFNPEAAWKGFALSCRQAYDELSEIAPMEVKKFVDRCLLDSEEELGYKPKLFKEIDLAGGFAALRRITVEIEASFFDEIDEDGKPMDFSFGDTEEYMNDPGYDSFDKTLASVLHPLLSQHFSKVTFLVRTDEKLRQLAPTYFYNDDEQYPLSPFVGAMEHRVWKKMIECGSLFQMLCRIQVDNDK
jgi:hypothetical protein